MRALSAASREMAGLAVVGRLPATPKSRHRAPSGWCAAARRVPTTHGALSCGAGRGDGVGRADGHATGCRNAAATAAAASAAAPAAAAKPTPQVTGGGAPCFATSDATAATNSADPAAPCSRARFRAADRRAAARAARRAAAAVAAATASSSDTSASPAAQLASAAPPPLSAAAAPVAAAERVVRNGVLLSRALGGGRAEGPIAAAGSSVPPSGCRSGIGWLSAPSIAAEGWQSPTATAAEIGRGLASGACVGVIGAPQRNVQSAASKAASSASSMARLEPRS